LVGLEPLLDASTLSTRNLSDALDVLTELLREFRGDGA